MRETLSSDDFRNGFCQIMSDLTATFTTYEVAVTWREGCRE